MNRLLIRGSPVRILPGALTNSIFWLESINQG